MLVAEAIQVFLDARVGLVSPKTAKLNRDYLAALPEFFGSKLLETITLTELRAFRKHLVERDSHRGGPNTPKQRLSPHTVHGYIRVVKQLFAWLCREEILPSNPAARLEQVPLSHGVGASKMMSDADFDKIIAASAGDAPERIRDRALLWFFRHTGARLGGAAHLTLDALELPNERATVIEKGRGGGKIRTVFFKPESVAALTEWLEMRACLPLSTDHVFTTVPNISGMGGGEILSENSIYRSMDRAAKRAGVKGRGNPHSQRHALAKRMLGNGASLGQVSRVLGHADVKITDTYYGSFSTEELKNAHNKYA